MFNFSTAKLIVVITLVVAGSALIGCWQTSSAQGWWGDDAVVKKLDLPDKTVQALRDKRYETQQKVAEMHGQLRAARLKLRGLLEQEKSDKAEVDKTIEKIYDLQTQIHKTRVHHLLFAKDQLTPEQRQKIKKVLKRRIRGQVGKASARTGQLYEPVRDRMHGRDRGQVIQRLDQQQRMRDRMCEPQWERQRPVRRAAQPPFAARGPQYRTGHAGRYSRFDAPFPRVSNAPKASVAPEEFAVPPQAPEAE